MRTTKIIGLFFFLASYQAILAQPAGNSKAVVDYVNKYNDIAVYEMLRTRIPASITLAQGILESKSGVSRLATEGHNHFGIKCKSTWTGKVILEDDDDFQECFRSYDDDYQSYQDHSNFLLSSNRYAYLFDLEATDYKSWAYGLKEAGYATSPTYASQLIELIERYNLKQYDHYTKTSTVLKDTSEKHTVVETNGIPSTKATEFDSYSRIATENKLKVSELLKMNDLLKIRDLHYGEVVYLKTKHNENRKFETHTVQAGESMHDIAQQYGIKLSLLLERNGLRPGEEPSKGEVVTINKKNKKEVKKRKIVKDETKSVDMRIHMGERTQTDSIIEAKYNTEALIDEKIDSAVTKLVPVPITDSLYLGNPKKNDTKESEEKLDEVINNELYHYVTKGESLYSISKKYKITVDELKEWNGLKETNLRIQQKLRVSNHRITETKKVKVFAMDNKGYYTIQEGDSLKEIAKKFGMTLDEITHMNRIATEDTLKVGDKLKVIKLESTRIYLPPFHLVKAGETLLAISRKYEVPVATLKKINSLTDSKIKIGMKLFLQ